MDRNMLHQTRFIISNCRKKIGRPLSEYFQITKYSILRFDTSWYVKMCLFDSVNLSDYRYNSREPNVYFDTIRPQLKMLYIIENKEYEE